MMETKEQNKQIEKNPEEMKQPVDGTLSDEDLGQVSGGMKILMDDEAAATKSHRNGR